MSDYQKLSDWARANNMSYKKAWNLYQKGELPIQSKETKSGRILVESNASLLAEPQPLEPAKTIKDFTFATATWADKKTTSLASSSPGSGPIRGNKVARSANETYNMPFIEQGVEPFILSGRKDLWDINWVIYLCQK